MGYYKRGELWIPADHPDQADRPNPLLRIIATALDRKEQPSPPIDQRREIRRKCGLDATPTTIADEDIAAIGRIRARR